MSDQFGDFSRRLGGTTSRRGMLKILGVAAGAAAFGNLLKPFRASAGFACVGGTTAGNSPCAAGTTACGPCCCKSGIACLNANKGICGCEAGTTPCGNLACCKPGVACANNGKSTCAGTNNVASCTGNGTVCGNTCCPSGQCCNNGVCGSCSVCLQGGDICSSAPACPGTFVCNCSTRESGAFFCTDAAGGAKSAPNCTTATEATDCAFAGTGFACVTTSCGKFCAPPCPSGT